jgi:alpha-L-arabinofuranosidase
VGYSKPSETIAINALMPQEFTATNPYGIGMQAAYPEHGFVDAMNDPELFNELAEILGSMHIQILRFPGGTWARYYSIHGPESMDALAQLDYVYILNRNVFGWSDIRRFFELCKAADCDALYQLNMKSVYNPASGRAYPIDSQTISLATADARQIALWAQEIGVKVFWEFRNEEYTQFSPADYVSRCREFYDAIKLVDPNAQFVICGDSTSWSDWTLAYEVLEQMAASGMTDIAFTPHHVYLSGGTDISMTNGQNTYDGIRDGWNNLKYLLYRIRNKLAILRPKLR